MRFSSKPIPLVFKIAVWAVALSTLLYGMHKLAGRTVDLIVGKNAEIAAADWAAVVAAKMPDLDPLLAGDTPSDAAQEFMAAALDSARVFRFKLFDNDGRVLWVSGDDQSPYPAQTGGSAPNLHAADVARTGQPFFELAEGDAPSLPSWYSEIYTPLVVDGRGVGVLELYLDETRQYTILTEELWRTAVDVLSVIFLAFILPAAAFVWRSRQLRLTVAQLSHAVRFDGLTGVLNRASMTNFFEESVAAVRRSGGLLATLYLDLDHFKEVNDIHGHGAGDLVLKTVAGRVTALLPPGARLARIGGDEFVICAPNVESMERIGVLAEQIVWSVSEPMRIDGHDIVVGASVGYALLGEDGRTADELLAAADLALYAAKEDGRGRTRRYHPSMRIAREERRAVEDAIRHALETDGFTLNFQPLHDAHTGDLRGFETLMRLTDAQGNPISPERFIPVAEEIGLINQLGEAALRGACTAAAKWPDDLKIAVNLSPAQFVGGDLVDKIREILDETGLPARRLELEITESLLIAEIATVIDTLTRLKALGVAIALDDFGTGYSSLSYLWRFPFDKLKVDKLFINELCGGNGKSQEILRTIVALGQVLELTVTAEGVETLEQAATLKSLDCDQFQGYLFGKPMPRDEADRLVAHRSRIDPPLANVS